MTTYSALLKIDGSPRSDMVLRDDGVLVLTYAGLIDADPPLEEPPQVGADATAYLAWLKGGGVLGAAVATPPPIPTSVPKGGLVRALMAKGDWAKAKAAIASDPNTQDLWDAYTTISRSDPLTQGMIKAMGYSDADVDALMLAASAPT